MYIALLLYNFFYRKSKYKTFFFFHKQISKHKNIELEIVRDNFYFFKVRFEGNWKKDHAGFNCELNLFTFAIDIRFYDYRHWDHENNCWEIKEN
jgi:hypothetical protein